MRLLPGFSKFAQFLSVPEGKNLGGRWIKDLNPQINTDAHRCLMKRNIVLIIAEILVMGGIFVAFIAPLLSPSEESSEIEIGQKTQLAVNDIATLSYLYHKNLGTMYRFPTKSE